MNASRWLIIAGILASFWPRLISIALFILDDQVMWDTGNEFDALGLVFIVFPLALIGYGLLSFRRSPYSSGIVILVAIAALLVSATPSIMSALSGGLGASSKQDVEGIDWATVAGLTVPLFGIIGISFILYYSARGLRRFLRTQPKCA